VGARPGPGDLYKIRDTFITTSLGQRTNICSPVLLIKIYSQQITGTVRQQWV
jgi:hypothetical protein